MVGKVDEALTKGKDGLVREDVSFLHKCLLDAFVRATNDRRLMAQINGKRIPILQTELLQSAPYCHGTSHSCV